MLRSGYMRHTIDTLEDGHDRDDGEQRLESHCGGRQMKRGGLESVARRSCCFYTSMNRPFRPQLTGFDTY